MLAISVAQLGDRARRQLVRGVGIDKPARGSVDDFDDLQLLDSLSGSPLTCVECGDERPERSTSPTGMKPLGSPIHHRYCDIGRADHVD